jgi:hypothetical protein
MYVELSILNDEVHSTPVLQLYAVDSLYILSFISKVQRFFFCAKMCYVHIIHYEIDIE